MNIDFPDYPIGATYRDWQATADRRLELLKEVSDNAKLRGSCLFCTMSEEDTFWVNEHDPDCRLAKELYDAALGSEDG